MVRITPVKRESDITRGKRYLIIVKDCRHALLATSSSSNADSFNDVRPTGWYACRSCTDQWMNSWNQHLYFEVERGV